MGMAASQARFLGITARKTNTEYEGQQVNQQRTALANQSANLFNQMLALEVPSPPSKSDSKFTKTVYSFIDDTAETATIQSIVNNLEDDKAIYPKVVKYTTSEIQSVSYRNALTLGSAEINASKDSHGNVVTTMKVGSYEPVELSQIKYDLTYKNDQTSKQSIYDAAYKASAGTTDDEKKADAEAAVSDLYKFQGDDKKIYYLNAPAAGSAPAAVYDKDGNDVTDKFGTGTKVVDDAGKLKFAGKELSAIDGTDDTTDGLSATDKANIEKIIDTYSKLSGEETFYKYTIAGVDYYLAKMDTQGEYGEMGANQLRIKSYDPAKKEEYPYGYYVTETKVSVPKEAHAQVTYDASGRLQSIILKDGDSSLNFNVSVNSITDEDAYEDAFNEYKFKMAQYEKEVEDINAKCKAIQEQDRTLELRLKQLDTEQEALTQEMDAIKKVIDKNVETTFKTFA